VFAPSPLESQLKTAPTKLTDKRSRIRSPSGNGKVYVWSECNVGEHIFPVRSSTHVLRALLNRPQRQVQRVGILIGVACCYFSAGGQIRNGSSFTEVMTRLQCLNQALLETK
jgi:hypothetical protein